jgi:hypothetical protein
MGKKKNDGIAKMQKKAKEIRKQLAKSGLHDSYTRALIDPFSSPPTKLPVGGDCKTAVRKIETTVPLSFQSGLAEFIMSPFVDNMFFTKEGVTDEIHSSIINNDGSLNLKVYVDEQMITPYSWKQLPFPPRAEVAAGEKSTCGLDYCLTENGEFLVTGEHSGHMGAEILSDLDPITVNLVCTDTTVNNVRAYVHLVDSLGNYSSVVGAWETGPFYDRSITANPGASHIGRFIIGVGIETATATVTIQKIRFSIPSMQIWTNNNIAAELSAQLLGSHPGGVSTRVVAMQAWPKYFGGRDGGGTITGSTFPSDYSPFNSVELATIASMRKLVDVTHDHIQKNAISSWTPTDFIEAPKWHFLDGDAHSRQEMSSAPFIKYIIAADDASAEHVEVDLVAHVEFKSRLAIDGATMSFTDLEAMQRGLNVANMLPNAMTNDGHQSVYEKVLEFEEFLVDATSKGKTIRQNLGDILEPPKGIVAIQDVLPSLFTKLLAGVL